MLNVVLQYSGDDGTTFTNFDILSFPEEEGTGGDCGGPDVAECNACGLPQAGADDCVSACTPPPPPTRHTGATCGIGDACPGGMFCNFDGGDTGFCEMCLDCGIPNDNR